MESSAFEEILSISITRQYGDFEAAFTRTQSKISNGVAFKYEPDAKTHIKKRQ
jgi:hypothetical protein